MGGDAVSFMLTEGVTQLVVLEDDKPQGTVTLESIAAMLAEDRKAAPA